MARYRDDGEVQIDNSTKVHFRNAFQQLIMIAALNVGTLLGSQWSLPNPVPPRFNASVMQPVCIADPNPIRYQHAGD
jgi:hypothetical protein